VLPRKPLLALVVTALLASAVPVLLVTSRAPASPVTPTAEEGDCYRVLEEVEWHFDPCIPEGEPLSAEVQAIVDQDRIWRLCQTPESAPPSSPAPCLATEPVPTTTPPAVDACTAGYTVVSSWAGGFQAEVTVRNEGSTTLTGWMVRWTFANGQTIVQLWNGALTTSGAQVTVGSRSYNATLTPNGTTTFGFVSTWNGINSLPTPECVPATAPTSTPTPSSTTVTPSPVPPTPTAGPTATPTPSQTCDAGPPQTADPTDPAIAAPAASKAEDAARDLVSCRDPKKIPDPGKPLVLVAAGDSITSAHHQKEFSLTKCGETMADGRDLPGNDGEFSYAGRYAKANAQVVKYYNFARTGFPTTNMLGPGPTDTWRMKEEKDACGNEWGRDPSPTDLVEAVVKQAKVDKQSAYVVSTGGINNTNWGGLLEDLLKCRALEKLDALLPANINVNIAGIPGLATVDHSMTWAPTMGEGKAAVVPKGGQCIETANASVLGKVIPLGRYVQRVRAFNLDAVKAEISRHVEAIVKRMLLADADKVVWMLYYDMSAATIDIGNFAFAYLKVLVVNPVAVRLLPARPVPLHEPLIDPMFVEAVKGMRKGLNEAIQKGLPKNDPRVKIGAADPNNPAQVITATDMQDTAIGGSPHPNDSGHDKLLKVLTAQL
jgi:hypothetical protein